METVLRVFLIRSDGKRKGNNNTVRLECQALLGNTIFTYLLCNLFLCHEYLVLSITIFEMGGNNFQNKVPRTPLS